MAEPIYTIGHSNRSGDMFLTMLELQHIQRLVDVRAMPRSRFNPQFNEKALAKELATHGIAYRHMPELGGKRAPAEGSRNSFFRKEGGLQSYADYMATPQFHDAIDDLLAQTDRIAIMCAEAKPENCHRQLVADALLQRGRVVVHIVGVDETRLHGMHPAARVDESGQLYYLAKEKAQMTML